MESILFKGMLMLFWLVLANFSFSLGLMVLIWLIQILHYPSFAYFSDTLFRDAMTFHQNRISVIVMPLMLGELAAIVALCSYNKPTHWIQGGIVLMLWLVTFLQFVPMHQTLLMNKDLTVITKLVSLNWIRTFLWTAKAVLSFFTLFEGFRLLK